MHSLLTLFSTPTSPPLVVSFFFFNDTATTEIYTLSLHDALPISTPSARLSPASLSLFSAPALDQLRPHLRRSEEHTSELQSPDHLVCRLLLEKKKKTPISMYLHSWSAYTPHSPHR